MATIPLSSGPQVRPGASPQTVSQVTGTESAVTGARQLTQIGGLVEELAKQEAQAIETRDRVQMETDLANFEVESLQRSAQLAIEGTGEEGHVKGVMNDFEERKLTFLETQPEYLRSEAQLKLLQPQTVVAKNALATQNRQYQRELTTNSADFRNNVVNTVRFGTTSEEIAMQKVEAFVNELPEGLQEAELEAGREAVRRATLARQVEDDPTAAIEAVRAGSYNDVEPGFVEARFGEANRALSSQKTESERLVKQAYDNRWTDPVLAAQSSLAAEGVENPTPDDLQRAQADLNIPKSRRSVLTKNAAQEIANQLASVTTVEEFFIRRAELTAEAEQLGATPSKVAADVRKLADMPMALSVVMDAGTPQPGESREAARLRVDPTFMANALQIVQNPKAGEDARRNIARTYGQAEVQEVEAAVWDEYGDQIRAMHRSGVPVEDISDFQQTMVDIASITYDEHRTVHNSKRRARNMTAGSIRGGHLGTTIRADGNDGYILPDNIALQLSNRDMQKIRINLMRDINVFVPESFATRELGVRDLVHNSGWTMAGHDALTLRNAGQPVYLDNGDGTMSPITLTYDQLSEVGNIEGREARGKAIAEMIQGESE